MDSTERHKLKKLVKELETYRGRHTELVTYYIPQGYDLTKVTQHLFQEQGTAGNIKSTSTRKNVTDALEKMMQHLKLYTRTPENGLAVFAGNVSEKEGQPDLRVWSLEPPMPVKIRLYRCDKEFVLDPIRDMTDIHEFYGLVVMDRRQYTIGLLRGKTIQVLSADESQVPGKYKAGGQSAARFGRIRENLAYEFYDKVAHVLQDTFLTMKGVKGILVGGPGPSKYEMVESGYLNEEIKKKIIAIKDISYTDEFGLNELLERCEDVLAAEEFMEEKKIVTKFFEMLAKESGKVEYGLPNIRKVLEMGVVDTLMISESISDDIVEELEEAARKYNSTIKIISTETREGVQLKEIGGIAAILRYSLS